MQGILVRRSRAARLMIFFERFSERLRHVPKKLLKP